MLINVLTDNIQVKFIFEIIIKVNTSNRSWFIFPINTWLSPQLYSSYLLSSIDECIVTRSPSAVEEVKNSF